MGAAVATSAVVGSLMLTSPQEAFAARLVTAGVPVGLSADGSPTHEMPGMDMSGSTPEPTHSQEMPGMDMPEMDHGAESTPEPTHSQEMPGMEHGSGDAAEPGHDSGEMPGMEHGSGDAAEPGHDSGEMPGMEHGAGTVEEAAADRPLAPVLGTFGGGASAVLLTAGLMRRKDRAANAAKQAARAARRSSK